MKSITEEWSKEKVSTVYDGAAATYNRVGPSFFSHFGRRLTNVAEIAPGMRVLDIATGTGAVLVSAATLTGSQGRVTGLDLSPRMVERARAEIRNRGLNHCNVLVADAEHLPFPAGAFDRALCSFAIFLLPDLVRLFSECHRVLAPTGRVGFVYSAGVDEGWNWYEELISRFEPKVTLATERYDPRRVEEILDRFRFVNIETRYEECCLVFASASEFWQWAWSHRDRAVLESLAGDHSEFKRELFDEIRTRSGAKGLSYRVPVAITLATKARTP